MKKIIIFGLLLIGSSTSFSNETLPPLNNSISLTVDSSPAKATPVAENPDVENQVAGDYPALSREENLPLGAIQHAWDNAPPGAGVYQVHYNPQETIKLKTREYMTTAVVFPAWEKIEEVVVGDPSNYQITKPKDNVVLIRSISYVGLDSSITMMGETGHVYSFYVRTEGHNSTNVADLKVNVLVPAPLFTRNGKRTEPSIAERTDYLDAVAFDPSKLDFDFTMAGDSSIAPDRVFSDGVRTWFDYGKKMGSKSLPTIYAVIDGVDTPINVSRDGARLVAQATGSFTLKSGEKTTCVYPSKKRI